MDRVWLTVNNFCNFKCEWCYAKSADINKNMSLSLAKRLVDFSNQCGASTILIIGGEPTYYPDILTLIKYIRNKNMNVQLVTNGYRLADKNFLDNLVNAGLNEISFSLKANNKENYKKLVKVDALDTIQRAMDNLSDYPDLYVKYSFVYSKITANFFIDIAKMIAKQKVKRGLCLSFCWPFFFESEVQNDEYIATDTEIVNKLTSDYDIVNDILNGYFAIQMTLRFCMWPDEFMSKLIERKQISCGCIPWSQRGIIFDHTGKLLLCHSLKDFPIGQYGVDFLTSEEYRQFLKKDQIVKLKEKFFCYPSIKCVNCKEVSYCLGGCPLIWFIKDGKDI